MKARFKEWLISLNEIAINELGIDEMLSHLDDKLNIINGNTCEQEILKDLIQVFKVVNITKKNKRENDLHPKSWTKQSTD